MTIAMSCKLIDTHTEVLVIDEVDKIELVNTMKKFEKKVTSNHKHPYSLFVVGDSLIKITEFSLQSLLMSIADNCASFVVLS